MTEDRLWKLVERLSPSDRAGALKDRLAKLSPKEIVAFQARFDGLMNRAYDYGLWAAASLMTNGWCSDDMFEYFRSGLIARGRRVYADALANPDSMANWAKPGCWVSEELVIYAASQTYEELTGREMEYPEPTEAWTETGDVSLMQNPKALKRAFPKLWEKFVHTKTEKRDTRKKTPEAVIPSGNEKLAAMARCQTTSPVELRHLAVHRFLLEEIVVHPNCPSRLLSRLSLDPYDRIRYAVGSNPACPKATLRRLATDASYVARSGVAKNLLCPAPVLRTLSRDPVFHVRYLVAKNPSCPPNVLTVLAGDVHPTVAAAGRASLKLREPAGEPRK